MDKRKTERFQEVETTQPGSAQATFGCTSATARVDSPRVPRELHVLKTLSRLVPSATKCGGATARRVFWQVWLFATTALACTHWVDPLDVRVVEAERGASCSWFGDRRGDLLYFGVSRFWADSRQLGSTAALESREAARIGRFDLAREIMLPSLRLPTGPERGGVWDVLALEDGRVVYTGLAELAAWVDPSSATGQVLAGAGAGANEIAALSGGAFAITQYFAGSLLIYGATGTLERTIRLSGPPGARVAPKSVAFDPGRGAAGWLWITTDLFPSGPAAAPTGDARHDARAIDLETGLERVRLSSPELQNLAFDAAGTGFLVWSGPQGLTLQILARGDAASPAAGRSLALYDGFDPTHDFAQDVVVEPPGRVLVTLWSGRVFVLEPDDRVRSVQLPRDPAGSLYYSAAVRGDRVCATRCGGVVVVCADLP